MNVCVHVVGERERERVRGTKCCNTKQINTILLPMRFPFHSSRLCYRDRKWNFPFAILFGSLHQYLKKIHKIIRKRKLLRIQCDNSTHYLSLDCERMRSIQSSVIYALSNEDNSIRVDLHIKTPSFVSYDVVRTSEIGVHSHCVPICSGDNNDILRVSRRYEWNETESTIVIVVL